MTTQNTNVGQSLPSAKITISENALLEDMGDEAVILNINNERYYGLDPIGMNFWNWLKEEGDIDKVLEHAQKEYAIDVETLKKDIGVFVIELHNAGLLSFVEDNA